MLALFSSILWGELWEQLHINPIGKPAVHVNFGAAREHQIFLKNSSTMIARQRGLATATGTVPLEAVAKIVRDGQNGAS